MTATTRTDIAAFITAQLDADEAAARAARSGPWRANLGLQVRNAEGTIACWDCCGGDPSKFETTQAHIARHDPARVLAQVASLRAVVELHTRESWEQNGSPPATYTMGKCPGCGHVTDPCPTLRALASIWKDEPTFDAGWAE